ncbi:MAG TPA: rhodanese-like domain-containing protein [Dissulfurispiraceae bacterium]|nr:rhodanese-like domain-containing protein [Dissulfurispiraceae bacterium]
MSPSSARKAEKLGYTNVKVYRDGIPAWKQAGMLSIACVPCLTERVKFNIPTIIVDLRPVGEARKEHIPGAVSIPLTDVSHAVDKFPKDKKAPIVLYSYDTASAIQAFEVISFWGGFTNIVVLDGGFKEWKKAGYKIETGDMAAKIVYEPQPRPGEIAVEDFKKIAETHPTDTLILDVRDQEEAENGMLVGAKNIPTQEVTKRLAEIPKDKKIVVHCLTGVRAELAYHALKDAGYNARFLNANIKIDPHGRYEITKE